MTTPNANITKTPRPVYYLMGKQAQGNSHPGCWVDITSSASSWYILDQLEAKAAWNKTSLYYTELSIRLDMGSIKL
jgi:hypothetical protein